MALIKYERPIMLNYFLKYYNSLTLILNINIKESAFVKQYIYWLKSSMPDHIIDWLENTDARSLRISFNEDLKQLTITLADRNKNAKNILSVFSVALTEQSQITNKINSIIHEYKLNKTILDISEKYFFIRDFIIPKSAKNHVDRLSILEIEQKTPFNLNDIYFTQFQDAKYNTLDKLRIYQLIIRKDILSRLLEKYNLKIDNIDIIKPIIISGSYGKSPEIILEKKPQHSKKVKFIIKNTLLISLLCLIVSMIGLYIKQERITDELAAKISFLSAKAAKVREMADHASAEERLLLSIRHEKSTKVLLVDIIAEITNILPDSSYLTEIHLSEKGSDQRIIDIAGFSDSAVKLPALFDKSSILKDATLTAPITTEANEKKELFSMQAKIKDLSIGVKK